MVASIGPLKTREAFDHLLSRRDDTPPARAALTLGACLDLSPPLPTPRRLMSAEVSIGAVHDSPPGPRVGKLGTDRKIRSPPSIVRAARGVAAGLARSHRR
ncbi:hypothetical protein NL676_009322 [Syzygium grande]|nr:hypothetical protein NL676_009322 [Syzygium grande]